MFFKKIFESVFESTTTIISFNSEIKSIKVKIFTSKIILLDKTYPNDNPLKNTKIPKLQLPSSIIENTEDDLTIFKYMFKDKNISEICINNKTNKVSFTGSFDEKEENLKQNINKQIFDYRSVDGIFKKFIEDSPKVSIINPNLVSWYDSMNINSLTLENENIVTSWKDLSKSNSSAIPFTGKVTYSSTALNGKYPGIIMNDSSLYSLLNNGTFNNGFTMFIVFSNIGDQQYNTLINRNTWDFYNDSRYIGDNNGTCLAKSTNNLNNIISPSIFISQESSLTSYFEYLNGKNLYQTTTLKSFYKDSGDYIYIGTREDKATSFNGVMSEIMIYNSILPLNEINLIQSKLSYKWGIDVLSLVN